MNNDQRTDQQVASHMQAAARLLLDRSGPPQGAPDPLLSAREMATYDVRKLLRGLIDPSRLGEADLERSITMRAVGAGLARGVGQAFIPFSMLARDFNAGTAGQAGNLVGTETRNEIASWLRPISACIAAGATVLDGLKGDLKLPFVSAGSTAAIVAEAQAASETNPTTGTLTLTPYMVVGHVEFSRQLDVQSLSGVEVLVNDLVAAVGNVIDDMAINGTGTGQPLGVLNTTGIGDVAIGTNGGYASWDNLIKLEEIVESANGTLGPMGYVTSPKIKRGLRALPSTGQEPLWTKSEGRDYLGGTPAWATTNIPVNLTKGTSSDCSPILYGKWSEMFVGLWGAGIEVFVDRVTLADRGQNRLLIYLPMDVGVRQAPCFGAIKDSRIPA